jgi:hypothetical protein
MEEIDPQVLLCLLSVRMQGSKGVAAGTDLFKKGLKAELAEAVKQGWLAARKDAVPGTKKKVDVLDLTDAGAKLLEDHGHGPPKPKVDHAPVLLALRGDLEKLRQTLRDEIKPPQPPQPPPTKGKKAAPVPSPAEEMASLTKALGELTLRVQRLEETLKPGGADLASRIDGTFQALLARLDPLLPAGSAPTAPAPPSAPAAPPAAPTPPPAPAEPLRAVIRKAYDKLCHYLEFSSGLVEMPRLYHETRALLPELTLAAFHKELESLWSQKVIELKVLNEVRGAKETDKGFRRGDNLYYFVYWKR